MTAEPQRVELSFAPDTGAQIAEAILSIIERNATAAPEPLPPRGPDVEPWQFYSPHAKCEVSAYLDDRNQMRHVAVHNIPDVPKHWRRVYLAVSG